MTDTIGLLPLFFVGIDWGSVEHRVVVIDAAGKQVHDWRFEHEGQALGDLVDRLVALVDGVGARCHVAIELKSGPVVEALIERGLTVFAVNPKQTDRFRDRYMPSGAKDDRRDALVLASAVRTDADHLTRLIPTDRRTITLRALLRLRDELVRDRSRLLLRLREQLWRYYAQMLELADGELDSQWLWTLWEKAPTPQQGAALSRAVIARILRAHRVRRLDADAVLAVLRKPSLTVADGVAEAGATHVRSIIPRLRLLHTQISETEKQIEQQLNLWSKLDAGESSAPDAGSATNGNDPSATNGNDPSRCEQPDEVILRSLPGVGPITLAVLLAEVREPLDRRDYTALRSLFGVAPITRQSGDSRVVIMRKACSHVLRNAAFNWARAAVRYDARCRARYAALLARGKKKAHAYRAVIDHLLRVGCAMLRAGTLYDVSHAARAA
jgi:transposase